MKRSPITEEEAMAPLPPTGEVAQLRIPPHSPESESSVLGGLLLDAAAWDRIGDLLTEGDFYRHEHKLIFGAIAALANSARAADVVTVYEHLQRNGKGEEVGGLSYLNSLAQYVPSAGNIRRYAEIVRERSILRGLISATDEIATRAFNPAEEPVQKIVDDAQQRMFEIGAEANVADDWVAIDKGVVELLDYIQEHSNGEKKSDFMPTGINAIDIRLNGGLRAGQLVVIAARPSMGKSALAQIIADTFALRGDHVGEFSMEMERKEIAERQCAMHGRIHLSRVQRPERLRDEDWPHVTEFVEKMRRSAMSISDKPGLNINQIRARSRKLKRLFPNLKLIVVDYLQLMAGVDPKMRRHEQIGQITQGLKKLAKELKVAVIALAQVGRGAEDRAEGMPTMRDLKDSGDIEQDADIIIFINRPIKADSKLSAEWDDYAAGMIAKNRNGATDGFDLMYEGKYTLFSDWPADRDPPTSKTKVKRSTTVKPEDM